MIDDLTRPIIGIENRTAQEVFDIMVARIGRAPVLAFAKPKEAEGWRDIASAPKDGVPFLAVVWGQVRAIKWCAAWEVWFDDGTDFDKVDYENDEIFGIGALLPTHWQPLPEPPSAAGDGE